ncbi:transposase [Lachnospiraceae bacterium 45-W7]
MINELFPISDDEIVESLMLDVRYQYALHFTSYDEQSLSDKSLSRFRKRCYVYKAARNAVLLHDCVTDLGKKILRMMKVSPGIRSMDYMMIEANIKKLSRTELLYTCIFKLVRYFHKNGQDFNDVTEYQLL